MSRCIQCGASLNAYDIGMHRKMINRGADRFLCLPCLAQRFKTSEARLWEKIRQFQEDGCSLFPPLTEEEKNERIVP